MIVKGNGRAGAQDITLTKPLIAPLPWERSLHDRLGLMKIGVYADSCGLKTAFLGNGGRKAATIFSLRYSSSR